MGLFDRLFFLGGGRRAPDNGADLGTLPAATGLWDHDDAAADAIRRHHGIVERSFNDRVEESRQRTRDPALRSGDERTTVSFEDGPTVDQVIRRLRGDADPHMRALAARTLAMMPGRKAMEALAKALNDPDPIVRDAAHETLTHLGISTFRG